MKPKILIRLFFAIVFLVPISLLFTNATTNELKISDLNDIASLSAAVTSRSAEYLSLKRVDASNSTLETVKNDFKNWSKIANNNQAVTDFQYYMTTLEQRINENKNKLGVSAKLSADGYALVLTGSNSTPLGRTVLNTKIVSGQSATINVFSQLMNPNSLGYVLVNSKVNGFYIRQDFFVNSSSSSEELIGLTVHEGIIHAFTELMNEKRQILFSGFVTKADKSIIGNVGYGGGYFDDELRAWYETVNHVDIDYRNETNYSTLLNRLGDIVSSVKVFKGLKNGTDLLIGEMLGQNVQFSIPKNESGQIIKNTVRAKSASGHYDIFFYGAENLNLEDTNVKLGIRKNLISLMTDLYGNISAMAKNVEKIEMNAVKGYVATTKKLLPTATIPNGLVESKFEPLTKDESDAYKASHAQALSKLKSSEVLPQIEESKKFYIKAYRLDNSSGLGVSQVSKTTANKERVNVFSLTMYPRTVNSEDSKIGDPGAVLAYNAAVQKMLVCDPGSDWSNLIKEVSDKTKYKTAKEILDKMQEQFNVLLGVDIRKTGVLITDGNQVVSIKKIEVKVGESANEYYVDDSSPIAKNLLSTDLNENIKIATNTEIDFGTQTEKMDLFSSKLAGGLNLEINVPSNQAPAYAANGIGTSTTGSSGTSIDPVYSSSINVKVLDRVTNTDQGTTFLSVVPNIPESFKGENQIVQAFTAASNQSYFNNLMNLPVASVNGNQVSVDPFAAIKDNIRMEPICDYCVNDPFTAIEIAKFLGIEL